jgi:ABC-type bacteriocin/lantibiotic exporter with double-glycine peptidase domain
VSVFRVYRRVLGELRPERGLVWALLAANAVLAGAQFAEPWLLGLVIDALTRPRAEHALRVQDLLPLASAWVLLGLFNVSCGALVALHADRLSHRRRLDVIARYFRHVLTLPLSFHTGTHSGRVLKESGILVFDRGTVVETGTFTELVQRGGRFSALARAQLLDGSGLAPPGAFLHSEAEE